MLPNLPSHEQRKQILKPKNWNFLVQKFDFWRTQKLCFVLIWNREKTMREKWNCFGREEKSRKIWREREEKSRLKRGEDLIFKMHCFFFSMSNDKLSVYCLCFTINTILSLTFILHLLKIFIVNKQTTPYLDSIKISKK